MINKLAYEITIMCFSTSELSHKISSPKNKLCYNRRKPLVMNTRFMNISDVIVVS